MIKNWIFNAVAMKFILRHKENFELKKDYIYRTFRVAMLTMKMRYNFKTVFIKKVHGGRCFEERLRSGIRHQVTFGAHLLS